MIVNVFIALLTVVLPTSVISDFMFIVTSVEAELVNVSCNLVYSLMSIGVAVFVFFVVLIFFIRFSFTVVFILLSSFCICSCVLVDTFSIVDGVVFSSVCSVMSVVVLLLAFTTLILRNSNITSTNKYFIFFFIFIIFYIFSYNLRFLYVSPKKITDFYF